MKQITINLYEFHELSEQAKQKAIDNLYDINVVNEWWDGNYYYAEEIGCKITGFDIDRGSYCEIELQDTEIDICQAIIKNYVDSCDTYKLAKKYLNELKMLKDNCELANEDDDIEYDIYLEHRDNYENAKDEFKNELSECYLSILRNEYEYLTSEEAIIETIKANEYTFTEDGKLKNG